jgi:hypothetical protein
MRRLSDSVVERLRESPWPEDVFTPPTVSTNSVGMSLASEFMRRGWRLAVERMAKEIAELEEEIDELRLEIKDLESRGE